MGLAGFQINVVEADPQTSDHLQLRTGRKNVVVDLGPVAHDQRPRVSKQRLDVIGPVDQSRIPMHRVPGLEFLDRTFVHEFGNDYVGHHICPSSVRVRGASHPLIPI